MLGAFIATGSNDTGGCRRGGTRLWRRTQHCAVREREDARLRLSCRTCHLCTLAVRAHGSALHRAAERPRGGLGHPW